MAYLGHLTHNLHGYLKPPENIDIALFTGDMSNPRDLIQSTNECRDFIEWYSSLNISHKVAISGNHDVSIEKRYVTPADFTSVGITYLENSYTTILGLKIFGTPFTPTFSTGWAFNKDRAKMHKIWDQVDPDTDIILSHGPPKGILDLSENREGVLEQCGDMNFRTQLRSRLNPKLVAFGHIHLFKNCNNAGILKLSDSDTIFSNGAVVEDGKFSQGPINNGNIIEL